MYVYEINNFVTITGSGEAHAVLPTSIYNEALDGVLRSSVSWPFCFLFLIYLDI